ncbi:uncharacterized protein PRCAT00005753001 [Priceomyces carsonii]|uniref:uncharacterized protein n=1 Tax=Priceomyces carsonii TaxID=28549 RepID=UPI002EDAF333|nr:unnamed protein product [Priceomyces carsonii]
MVEKRAFYEDDELIINKPGVNVEISPELKKQESSHGNITFVKGMGIRSTPFLEKYFNKLRNFVYDKTVIYRAEIETQASALKNEVNCVEDKFNQNIVEPVLPNLTYILTAALTGSILVNRRNFALRFITPIVFGVSAFRYYMPSSFRNVSDSYTRYEEANLPKLFEQRTKLVAGIKENRLIAKDRTQDIKISLQNYIHDGRVYLYKQLK